MFRFFWFEHKNTYYFASECKKIFSRYFISSSSLAGTALSSLNGSLINVSVTPVASTSGFAAPRKVAQICRCRTIYCELDFKFIVVNLLSPRIVGFYTWLFGGIFQFWEPIEVKTFKIRFGSQIKIIDASKLCRIHDTILKIKHQ